MHIDDLTDIEAQILNDTMEALGLQWHANFESHHAGNISDLLFTQMASQLTMRTFKGGYISDHRATVRESDIRAQHTQSRSVTFRNLEQINVSEFQFSLDFSNIDNLNDLQLIYKKYQNELTRVLNQSASERTKLLTYQEKRPWFDQDIAYQKRELRRYEMIWLRYRTEACWQAYLHSRRQYQSMTVEKKVKISKKIDECGPDSKKLFQLVNHLTGCKPENPLPTSNTDNQLADEFADFFISKILEARTGQLPSLSTIYGSCTRI